MLESMMGKKNTVLVALGLTVVSALAFWAVNLMLVHTVTGQDADSRVLGKLAVPGWSLEMGNQLLGTISPATLLLAAGIAVVVPALTGRWQAGMLAGATIGATVLASQFLKDSLTRPVPGFDSAEMHNSFPSGHAAISAGVCVAVAIWWPTRLKTLMVPVLAVGHGLMVASVMAAGWHRASDALGSSLLSVAVGFTLATLPATDGSRRFFLPRSLILMVVIPGVALLSSWAIIGSPLGAFGVVLASVTLVGLPALATGAKAASPSSQVRIVPRDASRGSTFYAADQRFMTRDS